jgi:hypothetical protein
MSGYNAGFAACSGASNPTAATPDLAQSESEGSLAGFNAAKNELAKSHMGQDLTDDEIIKLSKNPPPCPSDDKGFCKDFNYSWELAIMDIGLDRGD